MTSSAMRIALFVTAVSVASWAMAAGAPTHYTLDPAKSTLEYAFMQAGAQNKGSFKKFTPTLDFAADNLAASKLDVVVDMTSLDTGDKERDDTLRGPDLFRRREDTRRPALPPRRSRRPHRVTTQWVSSRCAA